MNIYAIGRNYVEHIEELNNERPDEPVIFTKPDTALLRNNDDFYYPSFTNDIHHEVEVVLQIGKKGKNISEKFAHKYYDQIGLGIDFTARDLQTKAKEKRLPWAISKGFHGAAPISNFFPIQKFDEINNLNFHLEINNEIRQKGNTSLMLFNFDYIVSYLSRFFTLKKGDYIYTGTPKGVGPVIIGDVLTGYIEDTKMFEFEVK
ncbi:MAG: fumarylacetoacetate hydrolase family protein [Cyclobacteriaceae bacterium]|nr:fumarylacetoacetate hydrolase family protein [Cyclobacteriaceae bacterium]